MGVFDWLGGLVSDIFGSALQFGADTAAEIAQVVFNTMLDWVYTAIFGATATFFEQIDSMGVEIFSLRWVQAVLQLFSLFGAAMWVIGTVYTVFDVAIEYQHGKADIKSTALNVLKGFFASSLFTVLPVSLYKFCVSLQLTFSKDLLAVFTGVTNVDISAMATQTLFNSFLVSAPVEVTIFTLLLLIAFAYCVVKIFFANLKRGGILLVQIAVGSLYMFSVPRGYTDGFYGWCKQVIALCLTAFMQTTLLYLGLMTFTDHRIMGVGIMLAASEVPRIAQQFGLDSSVKVNLMSTVYTANTAVNLARTVRAVK